MMTNLNDNRVSGSQTTPAILDDEQFEKDTGWTIEAAASMSKEVSRERRLFGHRSCRKGARRSRSARTAELSPAQFKRLTGWTMEDALDEALQLRRERRLFGRARLYR